MRSDDEIRADLDDLVPDVVPGTTAVELARRAVRAEKALAAALAWLSKADPYPELNVAMFRELRVALTAAGVPEPPQEPAHLSKFWADHARDMHDPEYRAAYLHEARRLQILSEHQGVTMKTATVYRTAARALKSDLEQSNYNEPDEPQFEVAVFSDGRVAQRWLTQTGSMVWWDSWEDLCNVHIYAHPDYGTRVEWSDGFVTEL